MDMAQLEAALRNADAAGDSDAARQIAQAIKQARPQPEQTTILQRGLQTDKDILGGIVRGAGSIGATLMWPHDKLQDLLFKDRDKNLSGLVTGVQPKSRNEERRQDITDALQNLIGSNPNSAAFQVPKVMTEVAGTAGAGSVLAGTLGRVFPSVAPALESSGFLLGRPGAATIPGKALDMATRTAAGGATGLLSAGLVNPDDATTGGIIGALLPPGVKALGATATATGHGLQNAAAIVSNNAANRVAQRQMQEALGGVPNITQGGIPLSTAAATGNVDAAILEQGSRLRNPNLWAPFDANQQGAIWNKVLNATDESSLLANRRAARSENWNELWDKANTAFTPGGVVTPSQLAAAAQWPKKVDGFRKFLDNELQSPSAANPDVAGMLKEIRNQVDNFGDNFSPAHLQQIRAGLSGSAFAMGNNPLKAAPRDAPATVSLLKRVDNILDDVTNGQWSKVTEGYAKDSAPVNASRAAGKVRGAFMDEETGRLLKTTQDGVPRVTEAGLTAAMNVARAPNKAPMLSSQAQAQLDEVLNAIRSQNIVQSTKRTASAGGGADTASNLLSLGAGQVSGPTAGLLNLGRSLARGRVDRQLAGLLQDPTALAPLPRPFLDPDLFLLGYRSAPAIAAD